MFNPLDSFKKHMVNFSICRNSKEITIAKGLLNTEKHTNRKYIDFYPNTDIQPDDVVSMENSNIKYYITDIDSSIFEGRVFAIKAYYQTTPQIETKTSNVTYNINNPSNSIIGSQQSAILNNSSFDFDDLKQLIDIYGENDKQQLYELTSLLKETLNQDNFHKGTLSKFGDLIAKHSWLPTAIAQIISAFIQSP